MKVRNNLNSKSNLELSGNVHVSIKYIRGKWIF